MIYELEITLSNVEPIVYRKIKIEAEANFSDLHKVIQLSFDWWDYHQHYFLLKEKKWMILPDSLFDNDQYVSGHWKRLKEKDVTLIDFLHEEGDEIQYTYDLGNNWVHTIVLTDKSVRNMEEQYPICIDAKNYAPPEESKLEVLRGQREIQTATIRNLQKKINFLLHTYLSEFSGSSLQKQHGNSWRQFYKVANEFYKHKAWEKIVDDQIFAFYIEELDEYLFCSILGGSNEIYGFTVYRDFPGFIALYGSLLKQISIETIMQYQTSILLQFDTYDDHSKTTFPFQGFMPIEMKNNDVWPHMTSYQAGFYPWQINEQELKIITYALEQTLHLLNDQEDTKLLPSFTNDEKVLLTTIDPSTRLLSRELITIDEISDQINPVNNAISEIEMKKVSKLSRSLQVTVEFSMQYVNIPIQRLKGNRPFFPVTSVMTNHEDGTILHHNMYDDLLQYSNVQRELLQMICHLEAIPEKILVDEFIYFYLQPIVEQLNLPVEIAPKLPKVDEVIVNISQILASK